MGCCQPVLGPIENYYTKYQIDKMLEEIESGITSGCCITPEEVDEKIDDAISGITPCDLSDYYTKEEVDALIPEVPSLSGYATEQWVLDKHYITGVDLSDYATKEEIPTVPTSNTAFTNDAGYLTEHQPIKTINGNSLIGTGDIEIGTGGTISIDSELSLESVNPVENKVITEALNDKLDASAYTPCDLSDYWTSAETQNAITEATSGCSGCTVDQTVNSGSTNAISNAAVYNNYMLKSQIWCGDYTQWASVSGNPDTNTIYLIHE